MTSFNIFELLDGLPTSDSITRTHDSPAEGVHVCSALSAAPGRNVKRGEWWSRYWLGNGGGLQP